MNMEKEKKYGYLKHSSTVFKEKAKYRRQIREQNIKIQEKNIVISPFTQYI